MLVVGEPSDRLDHAQAILLAAGFEVRFARPTEAAQSGAEADVVLADGGPDATAVIPDLRRDSVRLPVVVLCDESTDRAHQPWLEDGAVDCVTTSMAPDELAARVRAQAHGTYVQRLEKSLALAERCLEALSALTRMQAATEAELMDYAVEQAASLTGSTVAYLHLYDETQRVIHLRASNRSVVDPCAVPTRESCSLDAAGVWADCVRRREPVIHNDYPSLPGRKGYPEGHASIVRHMSVPVFDGGRIVAIAGVGNKPEPYDQSDVRGLSVFMVSMWGMLERTRAQQRLRRSATELEDKVRERTAELQAANDMLNDTFEAISHPLYVIDAGTMRIRMANSAAIKQGVQVGQLCYEATHERSHPCTGTDHPCPVTEVVRTGKPVVVEHVHHHAGSARSYLEIHGHPLADNDGVVRRIIEHTLDVTDRVEAQGQVQRRSEELRLINAVIGATVSEATPEAVLEVACREMGLALGVVRVDAGLFDGPQKSLRLVAAFDRRPGQPSAVARTFAASVEFREALLASMQPVEIADVRRDERLASHGDHFLQTGTVSVLMVPLAAGGELVGAIVLHHMDGSPFGEELISVAKTVGKQAAMAVTHARLSQARRLLEAAMEQTADSVVITDAQRRVVYVNPAFERVSGYARAEVVGTIDPTFGTLQRDDESLALWDVLAAGQVWRGRVAGRTKSGERVTEDAIIAPMRDDNGRIAHHVAVKRDVTRELRLEEHARQSQKLESVGRLAGGVAHDFNNLLGVILGYSGLALNCLPPGHEAIEFMEEIEETAQRGAVLARQLLTFARQQVSEPRSLDLWEIVENLRKMLRRLIGEDIELDTGHEEPAWYVRIDPGQLEQVIVNLAINARDAMPAGGRLTVRVRNVPAHGGESGFPENAAPTDHVELTIADSGVGMSDEVKEHIFEPFFTTKDRTRGTGLGLATCFGIVTQAGGRIWADSTPGQGTTMHVLLPRCEPPRQRGRSGAGLATLPRGSETVLLAEDDDALRRLACRVLRACGYTVLDASDGAQALEMASRHDGPIHLLLSDVVMRGMSGPDLARLLREARPETLVMFMSGYPGDAAQGREVDFPGSALLAKPFSAAVLAGKVRACLDGTKPS